MGRISSNLLVRMEFILDEQTETALKKERGKRLAANMSKVS